MDESATMEQNVPQQDPESKNPPKKGFLGRFFGGGQKQQGAEVKVVTPTISENNGPVEEATSQTPETVQDPETLKIELRDDLMRVVDSYRDAYFKEEELRGYTSQIDPEYLALKTEIEKIKTESQELSQGLTKRLGEARGVLGNFCSVVQGESGKEAVLLRSPLTREVTTVVVGGQNHAQGEAGAPLYREANTVTDLFYVNGEGVFKQTVTDPNTHRLSSVGNETFDESWKEGTGRVSLLARQEEADLKILKSRELRWEDGIRLAMGSDVEGDQKYLRKSAINGLTGQFGSDQLEGKQQYKTGLSESLTRDFDKYPGDIQRVTTSYDVAAAFDLSTQEGKKYKVEGEPSWLTLFEGKPNPVPAEPISKEVWNPEPYREQPTINEQSTENG